MIIMWLLWRRRNNRRHGKDVTFDTLAYQSLQLIYYVAKARNPWISGPRDWISLIFSLEGFRPKIYQLPVKWNLPATGHLKRNINGASRGNPGKSAYAYYLRN